MGLTGRTRYRTNWRGQVILQVEEYGYASPDPFDLEMRNFWRDAKLEDLAVTTVSEGVTTGGL